MEDQIIKIADEFFEILKCNPVAVLTTEYDYDYHNQHKYCGNNCCECNILNLLNKINKLALSYIKNTTKIYITKELSWFTLTNSNEFNYDGKIIHKIANNFYNNTYSIHDLFENQIPMVKFVIKNNKLKMEICTDDDWIQKPYGKTVKFEIKNIINKASL